MKAKRKHVVEKIDFYELFLILHDNSNIFELILTIKGNYHADYKIVRVFNIPLELDVRSSNETLANFIERSDGIKIFSVIFCLDEQ